MFPFLFFLFSAGQKGGGRGQGAGRCPEDFKSKPVCSTNISSRDFKSSESH